MTGARVKPLATLSSVNFTRRGVDAILQFSALQMVVWKGQ